MFQQLPQHAVAATAEQGIVQGEKKRQFRATIDPAHELLHKLLHLSITLPQKMALGHQHRQTPDRQRGPTLSQRL
jgi:hypothetical protein